jgi:N-acetylglucosamine-6-phosphate deacetylase
VVSNFRLHGSVITPDAVLNDAFLLVENGKIAAISTRRPSSYGGDVTHIQSGYISPGFVDIHVHGGAGADYMDGNMEGSVKGMDAMVRTMACQTSARLPDVIRMASLTLAERIGIADESGSL